MCTAATYKTRDFYFGRTLDHHVSHQETVTITPRNYPFHFRRVQSLDTHFAMIGMAAMEDGYPLYFEATNEKGLSMAGLYFPGNAHYMPECPGKDNVAPFEFIPWVLGQCVSVKSAECLLNRINLADISFSRSLPPAPLHWIISDKEMSITVESMKDGLKIYENPAGILTNNPPFDYQMTNLNNYLNLTSDTPRNRFSKELELKACSLGMGGIGLPGDLSSVSRFVRAAFARTNSLSGHSEQESISQFFHILGFVSQPRGCARAIGEEYEVTLYTSCCNTDKGIYYYTTYENHQISAVDMHRENLEGFLPLNYPLIKGQQILIQN